MLNSADLITTVTNYNTFVNPKTLSLIHISDPPRRPPIASALFCLKTKHTKRSRRRKRREVKSEERKTDETV